jgi:hypothetical protein
MKYKVLWIEDGAFVEVASFAGPVLTVLKYDLNVALNVSDALEQIKNIEFDAVIVDIRILPGMDPEWENLFSKSGDSKISARLGIQLLFSLLKPEKAYIKLKEIPTWILPEKFGVFTVDSEAEVKNELDELKIVCFQQKKTGLPKTALLELIEKVIDNSKKNSNREEAK